MTTYTIDNYYHVLGIQKNAPLEDIKKAYWTKAKLLHPDKNKNADAHEQFVLLNEAYEYVQNQKTGKVYNPSRKSYTASTKARGDWKDRERERARTRAQQYARMKYEEFIKTDHYKSIASLDVIASYIGFFLSIAVVVVFPAIAMILYGVAGLGAGILVNFLLLPGTMKAIRNAPSLNNGADSVMHIIKTNSFLMTSFTLLNVFIILKFGLQTLVSPWILLMIHVLAITLVYLFSKSGNERFKKYFYSFGIAPLVINALLLINFIFSFDPVQETYRFRNDMQSVGTRGGTKRQESTYIYLENGRYEAYPGIRVFLDYEELKYADDITYTFREGILGFRVMTDYQFK